MTRFKIDDFPLHVQAQIRAQLSPPPVAIVDPIPSLSPTGGRKSIGPNKTEATYQQTVLRGLDARYEAITFRMTNGHKYTPDWVVFMDGKPTQCHECKGSYALHSQQRARLAFDQCAKEFPGLQWFWAKKTPNGWEQEQVCPVRKG